MNTILILCLIGAATASGQETVGKHYNLSNVARVIVLEEKYPSWNSDYQYFAPRTTTFVKAEQVARICKMVTEAMIEDTAGPFIGHLCHFALLDREGSVVAMAEILNWNCLCHIYKAHRDNAGRIIADYGKNSYSFTSRPLAEAFYAGLKEQEPSHLQELQNFYQKQGDTLEHILFGDLRPGERAPQR